MSANAEDVSGGVHRFASSAGAEETSAAPEATGGLRRIRGYGDWIRQPLLV